MDDILFIRFHLFLNDFQAFFGAIYSPSQRFNDSIHRVEFHQAEPALPEFFIGFTFDFLLHMVSMLAYYNTLPVMNSYPMTPRAKKSTGKE